MDRIRSSKLYRKPHFHVEVEPRIDVKLPAMLAKGVSRTVVTCHEAALTSPGGP